jgi:hypothetical protein
MLRYFPPERRRRLAPLVLAAGLLTVGKLTYDGAPRDQAVHFLLPATRIQALRVTYSHEDELYGGLVRRFPYGSPTELVHTPKLSPGRYELTIELTSDTGEVTHLTRFLTVPNDGTLRIPLTTER